MDSDRVSPLRLHWVKGLCIFRCNLPPALLAEWPGSFTCHCSNIGVEGTPNKSQYIKLTVDKKILPSFLPGFEPATFWSRVWCSTNRTPLLECLGNGQHGKTDPLFDSVLKDVKDVEGTMEINAKIYTEAQKVSLPPFFYKNYVRHNAEAAVTDIIWTPFLVMSSGLVMHQWPSWLSKCYQQHLSVCQAAFQFTVERPRTFCCASFMQLTKRALLKVAFPLPSYSAADWIDWCTDIQC